MKKLLIVAFLMLLGSVPARAQEAQAAAAGCNPNLWAHVYSPERLHRTHRCVEITGKVMYASPNSDGDYHISVKLDPRFKDDNYINSRNRSVHHGWLVVELICVETPHGNAIRACKGFTQRLPKPRKGQRVYVLGELVKDASPDHGWMEIHPVSRLRIID